MRLTIFFLLRTLPAWLALPREDRDRLAADALEASGLTACGAVRMFDAEAFNAEITDILTVETDDLRAFYFAVERLRDTPLLAHPYFEIRAIVPAIEDGFRHFAARSS